MNFLEVIASTDWKLLAEQKAALIKACGFDGALSGLLSWIDAVQDAASEEGHPVVWLDDQGSRKRALRRRQPVSAELNLTPSARRMIDLSTAHIEKDDMRVFGMLGNMKPRAVSHEYGLIVFVNSDPNSLDEAVACMKAEGVSDAFIAIYAAAAKMGGDVMAINFDRDGEIQEGLPTFDW